MCQLFNKFLRDLRLELTQVLEWLSFLFRATIVRYVKPGLGRICDQVSADPEDPANYDLFPGLEITFKRIGSLITDHLSHIFSLIWP